MSEPLPRNTEVTGDDRLWGLLSYILIILFGAIILLSEDKKNRPFLRYHAVQSIALGVVEVVAGGILSLIPVVNCIVPFVVLAINIFYGIKANNGETFTIPVISDFVRNQGWV